MLYVIANAHDFGNTVQCMYAALDSHHEYVKYSETPPQASAIISFEQKRKVLIVVCCYSPLKQDACKPAPVYDPRSHTRPFRSSSSLNACI
jgi:hypothetical protein